MGVVIKQSIYSIIITYIGLIIGVANMYFFTTVLEPEQKGIVDGFMNMAPLIVAIGGLGINYVINKFLPYYLTYTTKDNNDFLYKIFRLSLPSLFIIIAILFIFKLLLSFFSENIQILGEYFYCFYFLSIGLFFYQFLSSFNIGLSQNIAVSFTNEIVVRGINFVSILLYSMHYYNFKTLLIINSFIYFSSSLSLIINLINKNQFKFVTTESSVSKRLIGRMKYYSSYSWITSILLLAMQFLDSFFIINFKNLSNFAYYTFATQLIIFVTVGQKNIINSVIPLISESWRKKDLLKLDRIYKKSANNFLWFGSLIFFLILLNLDDCLLFIRSEYKDAKTIIFILGLAKMIDLSTGVNAQILNLSRKYWRLDLLINVISILIMIPLNYFLVKNYGIIGCAFGNLCLLSLYNISKTVVIFKLFKIHPYSKSNIFLLLLIICITTILFIFYDQNYSNLTANYFTIIRIITKSAFFCILYIFALYTLNLTEDLKNIMGNLFMKIKMTFNKHNNYL